MKNFMSEQEIDEIEKRTISARPSPWVSHVEGRDFTSGSDCISVGVGNIYEDIEPIGHTAEDLDFIASARQDVPRLIDEIKRLRMELSKLGFKFTD